MALDSLSNSLERSLALNGQNQGVAVTQVRSDPSTNSALWSATTQYFVGDWVVDPADGQMYCYNGELVVVAPGPPPVTQIKTSVLGGTSPYNGGAGWLKAGPTGVNLYESLQPTFTNPLPAGGAWAGGAANVITVPAAVSAVGSEWLVTVQGTITYAAPQVATDIQTLTLTATGTGAVSASWTLGPTVGEAATNFSFSVAVQTGTNAPPLVAQTITLTGAAAAGAAAGTLSNLRLTAVRLF
jgi:hypothetical protein